MIQVAALPAIENDYNGRTGYFTQNHQTHINMGYCAVT
jgi:hypothetical protein